MIGKKPYIVPIPGTRKPERLIENLGAADVELSADEITKIDELLSGMKPAAVYGATSVCSRESHSKRKTARGSARG